MKTLFETLKSYAKNTVSNFWGLSRIMWIAIILAIVLIIVFFIRTGTPTDIRNEVLVERLVLVSRVADLSASVVPIELLGTVTSRNEAIIRAEIGGQILAVHKKLGDYVPAGSVIAEFENAAARAQVLQAEGAYEAATAGKDIAQVSRGSSNTSLEESKNSTMNAIASTYTILDDAIHTKTDTAWNNPLTREAKLKVTVNDAKLVLQIENARINIETMLREREIRNRSLTSNDSLIAELDTVESEVNVVKNYLNDLSLAWSRSLADNNVSQATIEGFKASTGVARASVTSALSVISGTRTALNASLSANQIAEINSSTIGTDSGSSADGQVKSALGNLRGAQARLEQTIVRSPIGGTINSLSISTGDFVSPYTEVAVVSNNGTLEIIAYVTEEDAQFLVVEGTVTIEGGSTGVITRIAPALDPKTNKIEVRIGITNGTALLTNGASVRISANRAIKQAIQGENKIPLSALKITPGGAVVFSVSASSTLVAHSVSLGSLLGDEVQISAGLTPEMMIVTDARGLQDGMVVSLK